jgi:hypothetical protein
MTVQYDTRRDDDGWTVFDRRTGSVVVLQGACQSGLPWIEADDLVERLNRRHLEGNRSILQ